MSRRLKQNTCDILTAGWPQIAGQITRSKFGLSCLTFSNSEFDFWNLWIYFWTYGRSPWTGISPSQGHYLPRIAQYRKTRTHIRASSGIRTHDPRVLSDENRTCLRRRGHWDRPNDNTPFGICNFKRTLLLYWCTDACCHFVRNRDIAETTDKWTSPPVAICWHVFTFTP
jgi:hypothetical protein